MACRAGDHTLVRLRTFLTISEADMAKSALEAAGIECLVRADDAGGLRPDMQMRGVDLLVRADDVTRAEAMLAS
jgi:hypothetical protein